MAKLLIVDDEKGIRDVIREYAEFGGYEVAEKADGMEAVEFFRDDDADLIVMDVMMPKLDGFSAVKEIKKMKDVPVIMLSARGEEYDKLFAFEVGVDDYVVKPFSPKELMARIGVVLSRKTPPGSSEEHISFDGLVIDLPAREVTVDGEKIALTPKEYDLLVYLAQNKNVALSRDVLLSDIWGYEFGDLRTIDTHVKNLRNAIGPYRNRIATLRGVGYRFDG
ncbi:MAG: response regulator transcription factor [Clostridiales Family XIII bacterium]|jgi:DNA-binding response OmpR family regulator|nr:response regulator transcription factor [Clostridiales Family XIII bacterium]